METSIPTGTCIAGTCEGTEQARISYLSNSAGTGIKDNMSNNSQGAVNSGRGKAKENNKGKKNNPRKTREEKMVRSET